MYGVTKTYGHGRGLSAAFRQWRARSHCRFVHGYALAVTLDFEAETLDDRNWVIDFGSLADVKNFLDGTFDHKLLIAADDPDKDALCALAGLDIADVIVLDAVGCEAFAEYIGRWVVQWLSAHRDASRVRLVRCTVAEHDSNAAWWSPCIETRVTAESTFDVASLLRETGLRP